MKLHELCDTESVEDLDKKLQDLETSFRSAGRHCLVMDGKSLTLIERHDRKPTLAIISRKCETVLCCRMSPLHKAQIVAMAKNFPDKPVCAAIGDGANDVSMIQESHLGIGIMGKEGRQAVRCSDFAFSKFRFLKKAVLVHGQWYYYRISIFIMYVIYKNLAYASPQLYYAPENRFSAATLFESIYLQGFNILFTAFPIICYGVMEQNYSKEILLDRPELYRNIANNSYMRPLVFLGWVLLAYFHSLIYFFFSWGFALVGSLDAKGYAVVSNWDFGVIVMTISVIVINVKLYILTKYWTRWTHIFYWGTMLAFLLFSVIYSSVRRADTVFLSFIQTFSLPTPWLCLFVAVAAACLPDFIIQVSLTHLEESKSIEHENNLRSLTAETVDKMSYSSNTPLMAKGRSRKSDVASNVTEMSAITASQ